MCSSDLPDSAPPARPAGSAGEADGTRKAEESLPAAGGRAEGADAGFEPGSLGRRGAGRRASPGGNGAGSAATGGRETNIKDYYLSGKNSSVYSEEGWGQ